MKNAPKTPALIGYIVKERDGKKYWTRIGVAWSNKLGGYNSETIAHPIDGKIVWLPPTAKADGEEAAAAE